MIQIDVEKIKEIPGLVASVNLTGDVKPQFAHSLSNMRDFCSRNGLQKIEYRYFEAKLVEAGRDAVIRHAIEAKYAWVLMIDADAGPFPQDALARLLWQGFVTNPEYDMIGAYAQLKQPPHLPVIDTGTGTWEPHFPNNGLMEVIRTGGHFILIKMGIFNRIGPPPWFRTRIPYSPAKAMAELDNFARCKLDGNNPLADSPEWTTLLMQAKTESKPENVDLTHIGEDSAFCDRVRASQGRIAVDTDIVAGHVSSKIIKPDDLKDVISRDVQKKYAKMGVMGYE